MTARHRRAVPRTMSATIPRAAALVLLLGAMACASAVTARDPRVGRRFTDPGEFPIRVALATQAGTPSAGGADAAWVLMTGAGRVLARSPAGRQWRFERSGDRIRAIRPDGVPTIWVDALIVRDAEARQRRGTPPAGMVRYDGRAYRGDVLLRPAAGASGILVVNRLRLDDYLLGVVPIEIGRLGRGDMAAIEAQAVVARSYAVTSINASRNRPYDVVAGVADQAYGGAGVEHAEATLAVQRTRGLVMKYAGRVVRAVYHSTCGGSTAEAPEVWRSSGEPYLKRVSDRIPGSDRHYCDIAPRFRWTTTFDSTRLNDVLGRYLATYATGADGAPGPARDVAVQTRTGSGRVGILRVTTERGVYEVRGDDIRRVLRSPSGEILNSTYFSVEAARAPDGALRSLTVKGSGFGHGIGMCQWGAIGRARAGHDVWSILRAYYPGASIGTID